MSVTDMIRNTTLFTLLTAAALGFAVFAFKYQVRGLEEEYIGLNRTIIADRQAIHVLRAEWSHLNEPRRLKELSARILDLRPVEPSQVGTIASLSEDRPAKEFAKAVAPSYRPKVAKAALPLASGDISNDDFTGVISQALADIRSRR
jgi:hypothetical protein